MNHSNDKISFLSFVRCAKASRQGFSIIEIVMTVAILSIIILAARNISSMFVTGLKSSLFSADENRLRNTMLPTIITDLRINDNITHEFNANGELMLRMKRPVIGASSNAINITQTIPNSTYATVADYIAAQQFAATSYETLEWISQNQPKPAKGSKVVRQICDTSAKCKKIEFGPASGAPHIVGVQLKLISRDLGSIKLRLESIMRNHLNKDVLQTNDFTVDLTKGGTYEIIR